MGFDTEKSKSEIKRELLALQELGRELTGLPEKHLVKIPLTDLLREEIRQARGMSGICYRTQEKILTKQIDHWDCPTIHAILPTPPPYSITLSVSGRLRVLLAILA